MCLCVFLRLHTRLHTHRAQFCCVGISKHVVNGAAERSLSLCIRIPTRCPHFVVLVVWSALLQQRQGKETDSKRTKVSADEQRAHTQTQTHTDTDTRTHGVALTSCFGAE